MPTYSFIVHIDVEIEPVHDIQRGRGRKPPADELVHKAAAEYVAAKQQGHRDHLVRVAAACGISRATAHRYLRRAHDAGEITYGDD